MIWCARWTALYHRIGRVLLRPAPGVSLVLWCHGIEVIVECEIDERSIIVRTECRQSECLRSEASRGKRRSAGNTGACEVHLHVVNVVFTCFVAKRIPERNEMQYRRASLLSRSNLHGMWPRSRSANREIACWKTPFGLLGHQDRCTSAWPEETCNSAHESPRQRQQDGLYP